MTSISFVQQILSQFSWSVHTCSEVAEQEAKDGGLTVHGGGRRTQAMALTNIHLHKLKAACEQAGIEWQCAPTCKL